MKYLIALAFAFTVSFGPTPMSASAQQACGQTVATGADGQVALSGNGKMNTRPFDLKAGAYTVRWTGAAKDSLSILIISLNRTDSSAGMSDLLVNTILDAPSTSGETQVYSVKPGTYYLDVSASNTWMMTITPQ